ncbi:flavodoxin domain-containing protein [Cytobacillus sp. FJAT-53684]|uniref:Flavodoxin domain-containing protein n=1 Tax=Cytobacillus mangrovibacter TaxID=3299024 RepID=A0ABW6JYR3_9BACI
MKIGIIYTSVSGNTKELALLIHMLFKKENIAVHLYRVEEFSLNYLDEYDAIAIGTYTWGDGEIPFEMEPLYKAFEKRERKTVVTGIFGTGDSFYPHYCGAVDRFRDLLKVNTNLAVTLKVELLPQIQDIAQCEKFVDLFIKRINSSLKDYCF